MNLGTTPLIYCKYLQTSLNTSTSKLTKKTKKKKGKIERNQTHAIKSNK